MRMTGAAMCGLLMLVAGGVVGCATPYERVGAFGGFDEVRIANDTYRISVQGNGYTSPERAEQIMLLRASELTLSNGFTHFTVEGRETAKDSQLVYTGVYGGYTNIDRPRGMYIVRMVKGPNLPPSAYDAALIESELREKLTKK